MPRPEPTVRARQLGAELRRSRDEAGMGAEQVAGRLGISPSKLSRVETGVSGPKLEDVAGMLALYGVTGKARAELLELCGEAGAGKRGWWQRRDMSAKQRTLIELESNATRIINYESLLIPGLLQTGEYTRAVLRDVRCLPESEIEDSMVTRLARHSVLRQRNPPRLLAIIYEAALRQRIGGQDVMRRQLDYLLHTAGNRDVAIRVVPLSAGTHPGLDGPFLKLESPTPVIYLESRSSSLFLEDKEDVTTYDRVLQEVLKVTLDAGQSAQLIADLTNAQVANPRERNTDERSRMATQLAQEQSQF